MGMRFSIDSLSTPTALRCHDQPFSAPLVWARLSKDRCEIRGNDNRIAMQSIRAESGLQPFLRCDPPE
jgi:hypothetical protein